MVGLSRLEDDSVDLVVTDPPYSGMNEHLALGKGRIVGVYAKFNGINNKSVDMQTALSAQYQDNQNYLSAYISGFYEQIGVADAKSEKFDQILEDAVKGRYENGPQGQGGQMFSAMVEAYPDLKGLDIYDKITTYVASQREGYRQQQSKLLDMLRNFDKYRSTGLINKQLIKLMGIPGDDLRATIGDDTVRGQAALDRMYRIVLTSDTKKAYETGEMEPLSVDPKETEPAPGTPATPATSTAKPAATTAR